MPLTKELELKAKDELIDSINKNIDNLLRNGLTLDYIKKYYSTSSLKNKKFFNYFLKDIKHAGRKFFENEEGIKYDNFVKKILNEVIIDRIAEEETLKMNEKYTIKKFNNFLIESIQDEKILKLDEISVDYLYTNVTYSENDIDIIAKFFNTKVGFVTSKNPKYNIYSVTDFKTDILKNHRSSLDVIILSDTNMKKMKDNVTKKILNGIFEQIPNEIDYMGIRIKLHTTIDKQKIITAVEQLVNEKDMTYLVSRLTNFQYDSKYSEYYIWKKIR
jgi:hypothetical protein